MVGLVDALVDIGNQPFRKLTLAHGKAQLGKQNFGGHLNILSSYEFANCCFDASCRRNELGFKRL